MEPVRILIAEDHDLTRIGIRTRLSREPQLQVLDEEATTGAEAIELAEKLAPDMILMDIRMPGVNGIEATRRIHQASPHIAILVLTMWEDDDSVFAALKAGARGYILKGEPVEKTIEAIRKGSQGEPEFSPKIAQRVLEFFATPPATAAARSFPELTLREQDVLTLMARGLTNYAIAQELSLSPKTVRNYVSNIFSKLQVANRIEAIIRAQREGLVDDGDAVYHSG